MYKYIYTYILICTIGIYRLGIYRHCGSVYHMWSLCLGGSFSKLEARATFQ